MKNFKFWMLAEETGAGDEPLAVDYHYDNLKFQKENEYEGDLKIYEIPFEDYVEGLKYLDYDVEFELIQIVKRLLNERN